MITNPRRISYAFIFVLLVFVGWLHLATPLITVLFSYFVLKRIHQFGRSKVFTAVVFSLLMAAVSYSMVFFVFRAYEALPELIEKALPLVLGIATEHGINLPFKDYETLRATLFDTPQDLARAGSFLRVSIFEAAAFIIGVVAAVSLFLSGRLESEPHFAENNLYTLSWVEITERFRTFFHSFSTVMGAQLIISIINTTLTAIFILWVDLPYPRVTILLTFFCGLLPIIGNVMSNTVIVGIALTVSPHMALLSLTFLVVLHKLEYFLNSKIIGSRIKNPMWLTLLGLILGERLMGIPGMILAPVVLHYIKAEASRNILTAEERGETPAPSPPPAA
ncbi:MAG: AI-2E family transporter [Verrucomicrobia bacterium]|nr:AI-2E family transporter [Verrucomicrobiota bacterium]